MAEAEHNFKDINLKIRNTMHRVGNLAILDQCPPGYERCTEAYSIYNPVRDIAIKQREYLQKAITQYGCNARLKVFRYNGGVAIAKPI